VGGKGRCHTEHSSTGTALDRAKHASRWQNPGVRILHVSAAVADVYGGPARVVREMCRALAARGHEVHLATTDAAFGSRLDVPLGRPVSSDGYTTWFHPCRVPRNPHVAPELIWRVARMAREMDVVHVHGLFNFPATFSQLVLRARGHPYVVRPCGLLNRYGLAHKGLRKRLSLRVLERANLERAGFIQASSEPERADLLGLGLDRVELIAQGVDTVVKVVDPPPLEGPYALYLGRLAEVKGLPRLVRAFARVAPSFPQVSLVLAGPDEYGHREAVEAAARTAGVSSRVVFPGMLSGDEKARYLAHARLFILASDSESFGVSAIEAAAYGLPLLVTTGVGLSEAVRQAGAGLVVAPTVDGVSEGLASMLERSDGYAARSRELAAKYSWKATAATLERHYHGIATRSSASHGPPQGQSNLGAAG
jgi:glycosyltransferase involved in cell wall biosynthesis